MFLPPVAIIVMSAPLLFPIITQAGFDPYWFAVVLTINMEIGLITPPVGLNLFVLNSIAPDVPTREILWGALDRKSVVSGKSVSVRVDLGGRRFIKKKKRLITQQQ